jgi:hypothetical protein
MLLLACVLHIHPYMTSNSQNELNETKIITVCDAHKYTLKGNKP